MTAQPEDLIPLLPAVNPPQAIANRAAFREDLIRYLLGGMVLSAASLVVGCMLLISSVVPTKCQHDGDLSTGTPCHDQSIDSPNKTSLIIGAALVGVASIIGVKLYSITSRLSRSGGAAPTVPNTPMPSPTSSSDRLAV